MSLAAAAIGLFLGGAVKGLLGVGLPLVSVPFLVTFMPVSDSLAIMFAPILATNFWQAFRGGRFMSVIRRFWPLLAIMLPGIWAGTHLLVALSDRMVLGVVGVIVVVLSLVNLVQPRLRLPPAMERPVGVLTGAVSGTLLAIALHMGPLLALYYAALDLRKDEFVRSLAMTFAFGTPFIGLFYVGYGELQLHHVPLSLAALVPALLATWIGERLRGSVNDRVFRTCLFVMLMVIGANLVRKAWF